MRIGGGADFFGASILYLLSLLSFVPEAIYPVLCMAAAIPLILRNSA